MGKSIESGPKPDGGHELPENLRGFGPPIERFEWNDIDWTTVLEEAEALENSNPPAPILDQLTAYYRAVTFLESSSQYDRSLCDDPVWNRKHMMANTKVPSLVSKLLQLDDPEAFKKYMKITKAIDDYCTNWVKSGALNTPGSQAATRNALQTLRVSVQQGKESHDMFDSILQDTLQVIDQRHQLYSAHLDSVQNDPFSKGDLLNQALYFGGLAGDTTINSRWRQKEKLSNITSELTHLRDTLTALPSNMRDEQHLQKAMNQVFLAREKLGLPYIPRSRGEGDTSENLNRQDSRLFVDYLRFNEQLAEAESALAGIETTFEWVKSGIDISVCLASLGTVSVLYGISNSLVGLALGRLTKAQFASEVAMNILPSKIVGKYFNDPRFKKFISTAITRILKKATPEVCKKISVIAIANIHPALTECLAVALQQKSGEEAVSSFITGLLKVEAIAKVLKGKNKDYIAQYVAGFSKYLRLDSAKVKDLALLALAKMDTKTQ